MPEMHDSDVREQLALGWKILLDAGYTFDLFDLMGFIKKRVPEYDEALVRHFVHQRYVEAHMAFPGRTVDPADFERTRKPVRIGDRAGLSVVEGGMGLWLVNPPHPQDQHGVAVAAAAVYILSDRRNEEAEFWTLEAAQALAAQPCGLNVKYVLEWQVNGWNNAQLLLLCDLERFLRKTFDPRFKVHPVDTLSSQARLWGVGHRRDFLVRALPRTNTNGR